MILVWPAGVPVVADATSKEGMRVAAMAGVATIEHGNEGDVEIYRLMANMGVALCPTLAASEAMNKYRGWKQGADPEPKELKSRRASFKEALDAGVTIVWGSYAGVFAHGTQARELELMVDYGMTPGKATTWFSNHHQQMNDAERLEANLPIGSGVTEAACKTIVKMRMRRGGPSGRRREQQPC